MKCCYIWNVIRWSTFYFHLPNWKDLHGNWPCRSYKSTHMKCWFTHESYVNYLDRWNGISRYDLNRCFDHTAPKSLSDVTVLLLVMTRSIYSLQVIFSNVTVILLCVTRNWVYKPMLALGRGDHFSIRLLFSHSYTNRTRFTVKPNFILSTGTIHIFSPGKVF